MSARYTRGSSVLAALILVTVIGGVALAVHSLAAPLNPESLTAAAANTTQSVKCDSGEKKTKVSDSSNVQNTSEQCLPGCTYTVTPGTNGNLSPTVKTSGDSNPNQVPKYCIVKYCLTGSTSNCPTKKVDIGYTDQDQTHANEQLNTSLSDYQKQALAQGTVNGVLGAGSTGASAQSDIRDIVANYYKSGGDSDALTKAFASAQPTNNQICADNFCTDDPSYADQLKKLEIAQQASDACQTETGCVLKTGDSQVNLNQDTKDSQGGLDVVCNAFDSHGCAAQAAARAGDFTCTVGGLKGVGCDSPSNPKEFYPDADEQKKLEASNYTCSQQDGISVCRLKSAATIQQPPCPAGNCSSGPGNGNGNGAGNGNGGGAAGGGNSGGGLGGIMQSVLGALAKALTGSALGGSATCTSDQNQYQQQQQQYQQQLTTYNQQLQQYNYQTQIAQMQGYPPPPAPVAPQQPCFNQNGGGAVQCTSSPAQPTTGCQGTWKPTVTSGNSCISGWQCVPTSGGGTPTAQLSCQPQVADVGMSIAISFSCGNSTGSAGSGFDTGNKASGSATTTIATPPAGATKVTYGLQCVNGSTPATASCSVDISKPSIILVANPKIIPVNASSTIGWLTTGMQSCVVSSPDLPEFTALNALNTSVNGLAITPALTQSARFVLHCTTLGGGTKDATATVEVGAPSGGSGGGITLSSSADGGSIARGDTVSIQWQATGAPSGAKMSLWLYDVRLGEDTALIQAELSASSTYSWQTPAASSTCDTQFACGTDLVPGREYGIEADLYTGATSSPNYLDYGYTPDTFTVSQ